MTDDRILDYLRSRGQAEAPPNLVASVMIALDAPAPSRSWFAAWIPAVAIAAGVAVIAAVGLLIGQGPKVGPSPASNAPAPSAPVEPTTDDLRFALLEAVDVLQAAPGVTGRQQVEIDGVIGSASWFDWRPSGDQVFVQRQDLDVTETGWWMVPDGAPPATGQRIYTNIQVVVGDELFFIDEAGDWRVAENDGGFPQGATGPAILDGSVLPWRPLDALVSSLTDPSEPRIERIARSDGGVEWELEFEWVGAPLIQRWTIGPGGELRSWIFERETRSFDPDGAFNDNATLGWLQYTLTDGDPIEPPDTGTEPDPAEFGLPADFPLAPDGALPIEGLDVEPRPGSVADGMPEAIGPVVEVMSGTVRGAGFGLTVHRAAEPNGLCLVRTWAGAIGGGCGAAPGKGLPEFGRFGIIGHEPGGGFIAIDGTVARDVARVWVVTDDGRRAEAVLAPFALDDLEASAFAVFLDTSLTPVMLVAADASGAIVTEFPFLPIDPDPQTQGPLPTPLASPADDEP